jgi:hypothetical protein
MLLEALCSQNKCYIIVISNKPSLYQRNGRVCLNEYSAHLGQQADLVWSLQNFYLQVIISRESYIRQPSIIMKAT